jgi:hypothetical protein
MALQNRPSRITTAALVEQAFCLQGSEWSRAPPVAQRYQIGEFPPEETQEALLEYHSRVFGNETEPSTSPSTRWMEWLSAVWGDEQPESLAGLRAALEKRVQEENVDDDDYGEAKIPEQEASIETLIGKLLPWKESDTKADKLTALWMLVTLVLANDSPERLQCGHLLSLASYSAAKAESTGPFQLDPTVLTYLGEAAALCQERWTVEKAIEAAEAEISAVPVAASSTVPVVASSPVVVSQMITPTEQIAEAPVMIEDEEVDRAAVAVEDAPPVPLATEEGNEAIEAVSEEGGRPDSSQSSSDSDSESESSSSSSSESSESGEPTSPQRAEAFVESERSVDDEYDDTEENQDVLTDDNEDEEEEYDTLRQTLAIAVSEELSSMAAVRVIVNEATDETEEEPLVETPVSDGPADLVDDYPDDDEDFEEEEVEEAEVELPALPPPPHKPAYSSRSASSDGAEGTDAGRSDLVDWQAIYDPTNEREYASLPQSHVLIHLMRYAEALANGRNTFEAPKEESLALPTAPGGMGAFLYDIAGIWMDGALASTAVSLANNRASATMVLQLMVTSLVTICRRRSETLLLLRQAKERKQRAMQGDMTTSDEGRPVGDEKEEDDPAMAFAMSHVEDDDAPLSIEMLENKGMRRKAAAAAHDTATRLHTLQKRTEALETSFYVDSTCILSVLRAFRHFVRGLLDDWISTQESSVATYRNSLPRHVRKQALRSLEELMAIPTAPVVRAGAGEQDSDEVGLERLLYVEATMAWSEASSLLFDCIEDQVEAFLVLLKDVTERRLSTDMEASFEPIDSLSRLPANEEHRQVHRLQLLSRRFRYGDVLNHLVGSPIPWLESDRDEKAEMVSQVDLPSAPRFPSTLLSSLRTAVRIPDDCKADIEQLYLALCHRVHTKVLLFDGLYAIAKPEASALSSANVSGKKGLASSAMHVHTHPSSRLQFDSTKCSDSIAIVPGGTDHATSSPNGSSVNQRASKVWGAVLSTHHFSPKTGIHRWAVKLDRCERGHVFIGVSTSQASVRTYVGGDKHGWGMIGTQALWHDRRKVCLLVCCRSISQCWSWLSFCFLSDCNRSAETMALHSEQDPPLS